MRYYYINLDRRNKRNNHIISEIKKSKIISKNIERFPAVDGLSLDISSIPNNILTQQTKDEFLNLDERYGISLTNGAVGCAMSHYALYKKCVEYNDEFLILEDDAIINPIIDTYLEDYIHYFRYDLLYFGFHRHAHTAITNIHPLINRIKGNIWGTFGYVITPKFAKYAIEHIFPISMQFDSEISKHINNNKIIALAFNTNVIGAKHLGTDVQNHIRKKQKIDQPLCNNEDVWYSIFT
jgi:glycosyl transferase family 25